MIRKCAWTIWRLYIGYIQYEYSEFYIKSQCCAVIYDMITGTGKLFIDHSSMFEVICIFHKMYPSYSDLWNSILNKYENMNISTKNKYLESIIDVDILNTDNINNINYYLETLSFVKICFDELKIKIVDNKDIKYIDSKYSKLLDAKKIYNIFNNRIKSIKIPNNSYNKSDYNIDMIIINEYYEQMILDLKIISDENIDDVMMSPKSSRKNKNDNIKINKISTSNSKFIMLDEKILNKKNIGSNIDLEVLISDFVYDCLNYLQQKSSYCGVNSYILNYIPPKDNFNDSIYLHVSYIYDVLDKFTYNNYIIKKSIVSIYIINLIYSSVNSKHNKSTNKLFPNTSDTYEYAMIKYRLNIIIMTIKYFRKNKIKLESDIMNKIEYIDNVENIIMIDACIDVLKNKYNTLCNKYKNKELYNHIIIDVPINNNKILRAKHSFYKPDISNIKIPAIRTTFYESTDGSWLTSMGNIVPYEARKRRTTGNWNVAPKLDKKICTKPINSKKSAINKIKSTVHISRARSYSEGNY